MRKKEIKVDFHIRKNQRNLGKHFFQGVISSTIVQRQAYLPLSDVRTIIAGKNCGILSHNSLTVVAQQPRIKVTSQTIFSVTSWKRHQPKMKIFALLSLFIFSAAQAQFFGVETGYNNTCLWEKEGLNR